MPNSCYGDIYGFSFTIFLINFFSTGLQWLWQLCSCKSKELSLLLLVLLLPLTIHPFCWQPCLFKMLLLRPLSFGERFILSSLNVFIPELNFLLRCCCTSLTPACFLPILLIFPPQEIALSLFKCLHKTNLSVKLSGALIKQSISVGFLTCLKQLKCFAWRRQLFVYCIFCF